MSEHPRDRDFYVRILVRCHGCQQEETVVHRTGSALLGGAPAIHLPPTWKVLTMPSVCVGGDVEPFVQPRAILTCSKARCVADGYRKMVDELDAAKERATIEWERPRKPSSEFPTDGDGGPGIIGYGKR